MSAHDATSRSPSPLPDPALGTIESTPNRFVWSPPITDGALLARKRMRMFSVALVLVAAVWAATSVWADGLDAVVFALIVPLMLVGIGVAIDRLLGIGSRLRIEVGDHGLVVKQGKRCDVLPLAEVVDVAVRSKSVDDRSTPGPSGWYVVVERTEHAPLSAMVPAGIGSAFDREEAIRLEATLRQRCLD